jgi:N-acetylglutamate synthase-like GNAT family acetyltransferase
VGYGISHPWTLFSAPALNDFLVSIPDNADCMHIHDIAVLPQARGRRSVAAYVALVRALAANLKMRNLACVSVYETDALWARYGFHVEARDTVSFGIKGYGPTAKYMVAEV